MKQQTGLYNAHMTTQTLLNRYVFNKYKFHHSPTLPSGLFMLLKQIQNWRRAAMAALRISSRW